MADAPLRAVIRRLSSRLGVREAGTQDDADLLRRFLDHRDETAFEVLVWRHGTMVLGVCQRLLRDAHAAEDAFQATFLALAREAGRVARGESVGGWLYRVAYRVALKAKARDLRRGERERQRPGPPASPAPEDAAWRDLRLVLDDEINRLPSKYRQPVVLCYLEGKTNVEAARELGCPAGTVATRLAWARRRLRSRLTRRGVALPAVALPAALGADGARAAPPAPLVEATVRLGAAWATGRAVAAAAPPVTLAEGVVRMLVLDRLKRVTLIVGVVAVLAAAAGVGSYRVLAGKAPRESAAPAPAPPDAPPPDARQVLAQALDAARAIEDPAERVTVLVQLAHLQGKAGDQAGGLKTLVQALQVARTLEEETPKGMALREIAGAQVRLGNVPGALRTAGLLEQAAHKNHLLFLIACQQAQEGDLAGALRTAGAITDYQRDGALEAVARAQARAGDVKAAVRMAEGLKHQPLSRGGALEEIALAQAKAGDRAAAAESLREALRLQTSTLAREGDRNSARARVAVLQARIGDVPGALAGADALRTVRDGGAAARDEARRGIAVEQVRAGDLPGALRTIEGIPDLGTRPYALMSLATAQAEKGDRAAALATLRTARAGADSLQEAGQREACQWSVVRAQLEAGDPEPALALVRTRPMSDQVVWVLLDVGRARLKAGDRAGAVVALRPAWDRAAALRDTNEDPMGVITLVPRWALMKGHLLREIAAALAAAGAADEARARAGRQETPYLRALALLGVAEGMRQREQRPDNARPRSPDASPGPLPD
jgi:RNA polymerase sigma factor (sigma-70 family)